MFGSEVLDLIAECMIPRRDIWQIAFDGSGHISKSNEHYAYGGVVGSRPAWGAFTERWEPVLNRFDVPYLRMTELMNWGGPYAEKKKIWGERADGNRDEILWSLVEILNALDLRPIGTAVLAGGLSEKNAAFRKKEVFQLVVEQVLRDHRERFFMFTCDTENDASELYRKWILNLQQRDIEAKRIFGMAFMDDKIFAPIQAADFVAFLLREDAERDYFRPNEARNPLVAALKIGAVVSDKGEITESPF